ncbi:MAG TPA: cytochrome c-type biogenesis protein CcmH [Solirubrobacteraceae bacterium]
MRRGSSPASRPTDRLARPAATLMLVAALGASPLLDSSALAARPRTSMPAIERQVMCVTCKIPLNVAESPQSQRERAYIRGLIAEGKTEAQVKSELVAQYGNSVLALPSAKGFDLAAYLVPVAVVLALVGLLALLLPSWRRHARDQAATGADSPTLSEGDAARLDADLEHFD